MLLLLLGAFHLHREIHQVISERGLMIDYQFVKEGTTERAVIILIFTVVFSTNLIFDNEANGPHIAIGCLP